MDPTEAREAAIELQPEAKSTYPTQGPGASPSAHPSLPQQFGLSTYPAGLSIYPIDPIGKARRLSQGSDPSSFDVANNSAVLATINTIALAVTEAQIVVKRESYNEGQLREEVVRRHPIYRLLRRPNLVHPEDPDSKVFMSLTDMVWLREYCLHVDGNSYWRIVRLGDPLFGLPVMLVPVMPYMMEPVTETKSDGTSTDFISYYAYAPSEHYTARPMKVHVNNVLHFRYGRDPLDNRKGLGLCKRLWREVYRDDISTYFTNQLLRNGAVPGLVVTPGEGVIDQDEAMEAKQRLQAAFSGDGLGSIAVLSRDAKVAQYGFNPDQMNLAGFHKHAEERVAAVLNVPAMVAQLGAGLDQAAQFSNFHEAREMFAENSTIPRLVAADEVLSDLMREFTNDPALRLVHDRNQIRALSADVTEKFGRYQVAVRGGWLTANEARALAANLPPINEKNQQVPLTQGEDNRLNDMLAQGLITVNEARSTVGLPPIDGGDVPTTEFAASRGDQAKLPEDTIPADAANQTNTAPPVAVNPTDTLSGLEQGGPVRPKGRQGANIKGRAADLETLFAQVDPDQLLAAWRELRGEGLHLVDVAFPKPPK